MVKDEFHFLAGLSYGYKYTVLAFLRKVILGDPYGFIYKWKCNNFYALKQFKLLNVKIGNASQR